MKTLLTSAALALALASGVGMWSLRAREPSFVIDLQTRSPELIMALMYDTPTSCSLKFLDKGKVVNEIPMKSCALQSPRIPYVLNPKTQEPPKEYADEL